MNPWDTIGWVLLGVIAGSTIRVGLAFGLEVWKQALRRRLSREQLQEAPEVGQEWEDTAGARFRVTHLAGDGTVVISTRVGSSGALFSVDWKPWATSRQLVKACTPTS